MRRIALAMSERVDVDDAPAPREDLHIAEVAPILSREECSGNEHQWRSSTIDRVVDPEAALGRLHGLVSNQKYKADSDISSQRDRTLEATPVQTVNRNGWTCRRCV
jgi:hypothetical protein